LNAVSEDWPGYTPGWSPWRDPFDMDSGLFGDALDGPDGPPPGPLDFPDLVSPGGVLSALRPIAHLQALPTAQAEAERAPTPDAAAEPGPDQAYGYGTAAAGKDDTAAAGVMTLIAGQYEVVLVGAAGSGKSTVARELQYRLAHAVTGETHRGRARPEWLPALMPVLVRGPDIDLVLQEHEDPESRPPPPGQVLRDVTSVPGVSDAMLTIGAVHLIIDAFNEVTDTAKRRIADWVRRLRRSFPFVPVMFCYRRFDFERNPLPYALVSLQNVTDGQARDYIYDVLKLRGLPDAQDRAAALASMLLDNPENAQIRDLAQRPLFLWMIVERYVDADELPGNIGALMADFSRWFVEERHRRDRPGEHVPDYVFSYEDKVRVLEAFGVHLVEHGHGETDLSDADAEKLLARLVREGLPDAHAALEEIVSSELLYRTQTGLRFYHQSFQEYFASRVFERESEDAAKLRDRTLSFDGRESMRMMLGYSGGRPALALQVIRVALQANPLDAAELLRACETPPPEAIEEFLETQRSVLADAGAGQAAWTSAAESLGLYRSPEALALMHNAALAPGAAADVRLAVLRVLLQAADKQSLKATVGALLEPGTPLELREAAVHGVGACGLPLLIQVSGLIADGAPWRLIHAARDVLERSGERLTTALGQVYLRACEARLTALEETLCTPIPMSDWTDLQSERMDLVEVLARAGRTDLVLARRFAYGIAADARWEDCLAPGSLPAAPPIPRAAFGALAGDLEPEDLLSLFAASRDPLEICAAGHALLRLTDPGVGAQVLDNVAADSMPEKLLVVAAFGDLFAEDPGGKVETLIRGLIDRIGATGAEPLAALLETCPSPKLRRYVLLYKAEVTALERSLDRALRRPLTVQWLRSQYLTDEEIDELLRGTEEEVAAAVGRLFSEASTVEWMAITGRKLSEEAGRNFASYALDNGRPARERHRALVAGASLQAYQIVGPMLPLLDDEWISRPYTTVYSRHGAVEGGSRLMDMFPALGYLARVAHSEGDHDTAASVLERLTSYGVRDGQEADEMARRIGLAYLGRWKPLLLGLPERGAVWHEAAVNCFQNDWIPGPYTPRGEEGKEYAAHWIAQELARPHGYPPAVRSTLADIKAGLETELRRYIVADDDPA
jgi:hypothetical protein